jgi:hypothetical protein
MSGQLARQKGRLLLFEPDPGRRYHFRKYVEGILWRGVSETERDKRIVETVSQRRLNPIITREATRTTGENVTKVATILPFCRPLVGNDRLLVEHLLEVMERKSREQREREE